MPAQVFDAALDWISAATSPDETPEITFHGGEPLLAGIEWYRRVLPLVRERLPDARLALQSNLWLLDDELCRLFAEYGVSLGTSLDGPRPINDRQRGRGSYRRTMAGIAAADKGRYQEGRWVPGRRLNGDETSQGRWWRLIDYRVRDDRPFSNALATGIGRCVVYRYE